MAATMIRPARSTDLDRLLQLLGILFSIEEDFAVDAERQRQGLEMMLNNDRGIILVAEKEGRVIGMCSGQLLISTAEGGLSLLVEDVVVSQSWQQKGIGTMLLEALEAWGQKKNALRLQLLADKTNGNGLEFYHKRAWRRTQLICLCKKPENDYRGHN